MRATATVLAIVCLLLLATPSLGGKAEALAKIDALIESGQLDEAKRLIDHLMAHNPGDPDLERLNENWKVRKGDLGVLLKTEGDLWKPEHRAELREASFLVVPSLWYEGFPLTIIEALACGVPVIGSRLGGVGEVINHEKSGLLFDAGNTSDLVASIERLWSDSVLRARLGAGARAQFEAEYTAEQNLRLMLKIFENVAL